jgi:hypothetical protein
MAEEEAACRQRTQSRIEYGKIINTGTPIYRLAADFAPMPQCTEGDRRVWLSRAVGLGKDVEHDAPLGQGEVSHLLAQEDRRDGGERWRAIPCKISI